MNDPRSAAAASRRGIVFASAALLIGVPALAAAAGGHDGPRLGARPTSSTDVTTEDSTDVTTEDSAEGTTEDSTEGTTEDSTEGTTENSTDVTTEVTTEDTTEGTTEDTTSTSIDDDDDHDHDDDGSLAVSFTKSYSGVGGSVTVSAVQGVLTLDATDPAPGFSMEIKDSGPEEIEVRFERDGGDEHETRIRIRVDDGRLREEVREDVD